MEIKLQEGMKFKLLGYGKSEFIIRKYDYYGNGQRIWTAWTDNSIYPLSEIDLDSYIPMVDGKWINEPNTYIE